MVVIICKQQYLRISSPTDHLACGACQARGSRSNSPGESSSCVRCCCEAGSTDYTGAPSHPSTYPRIPHKVAYLPFILMIIPALSTLLPHNGHNNQVVAAPQGTVRGSSPSVSLDQLGRPQANALASALAAGNHVKIQAPTVSS